ncbi:MAG: hypothetical protein L6R36_008861 [Xanthoria steineri]|nr:MAG: hypothetical protein L6R36_008861 [Xanthoria steineri]
MASASGLTPKRFLDLPVETQKQAFTYLSHPDLLKTLRVSSQFFALACAQLYRDLDFKLSNSDAHDGSSSGIQTAEALQTIIASDYNYGQYIKSFRLTMVDDNSQTSAVMSRFLWDRAGFASKALNVSLLLLVKKATMLESFFWDVPIELSGAVYQALQKIQGLRNLRLRLDVSLSLKLTIHPGPLPGSSGISNHPPSTSMSSSFPPLPPFGSSSQFGNLPGSKPRAMKKKKLLSRNFWTGNRELSGFKHLGNLSLLGISSLDYLEEISACMKSNTTSLKSLSLSLSYEMALKARKVSAAPPPAEDATSDEDDEELIDPGPPSNPAPVVPTTTEADVRKEKQAQETILARIFDMEQQHHESKRLERNLVLSSDKPGFQNALKLKTAIQDVKAMAKKLWEVAPTEAGEDAREAIEMIHKATAEFLSGNPSGAKNSTGGNVDGTSGDVVAGQSLPSLGSSTLPDGSAIASDDLPPGPSLSTKEEAAKVIQALQDQFLEFNDSVQQPTGSSGTSKVIQALQDKLGVFNDVLPHPPGSSAGLMSSISALQQPPGPPVTGTGEPYAQWPPLGSPSPWDSQGPLAGPLFSNHKIPNPLPPMPSETISAQEPVAASVGNTGLVSEQTGGETAPPSGDPIPLTATLISHEPMDESLDVDMTHPDEDPSEMIADQEIVSDEEDENNDNAGVDLPSPRKRGRFEESTEAVNVDRPDSSASKTNATPSLLDVNPKKEQSPEEAMQMWIRERHGYQLEEIKLFWVPMRAGILSRALDLAVLRRITLLNCGSQDGFWMILAGFQSRQGSIGLKSIHTDNVSKSFLKFLKTFGGLTELFMHERTKKIDTDASSSHAKVGITEIRQHALRKHLRTLERLMMKNETDSSWDLDSITIVLLSNKGSNLLELAISLGAKQFHHLMQNLSALKNLQALQLLAVRGANGGGLSHLEYLNSIVDNLSHHPLLMRIKYISVDNILSHIHRRPVQMSRKFKQAKAKRQQERLAKDKGKGKGKMTETEFASDASSETDFREDKELHDLYALKVKASMLNDPKEVEHIKIFQHEFRAGAF